MKLPIAIVVVVGTAVCVPGLATGQSMRPCGGEFETPWECGTLTVPENRVTGVGRTIEIAVKRRRATEPAGRPPIFAFAGGPGGAAAAGASPNAFSAQAATHDVVLIDQRGTGGSNGFPCEMEVATRPERVFGQIYPLDGLRRCYQGIHRVADPNQYTTGDFAADVDAVRAWLGYESIIVMGGSYGTRAGMTYMRLYPDRVAGAVLNAVFPPHIDAPATYAETAQFALDRVFADCRAQPACHGAYPRLETEWTELLARIRRAPVAVTVRLAGGGEANLQMSADDLGYAVRVIMYSRTQIPDLPRMIHDAATTGNLNTLAQRHYDRAVGTLGGVSLGAHFSVFCAEDVPWVDSDGVAARVDGTYLGWYLIDQYREGCRRWPVDRRDRRAHEPFSSDVPVLFMSGRYDPITPDTFAERIRPRFPNSRHIVAGDGGHGASGPCINAIRNAFFLDLDARRLPACAIPETARFEVP